MAKRLTPSDIGAILTRGSFDDLKGALEDEHLECKAAPYQLQHDGKEAPAASHEIREQVPAPWEPRHVAYAILRALYTWFGFDESAIPYTPDENGTRTISIDEIRRDG